MRLVLVQGFLRVVHAVACVVLVTACDKGDDNEIDFYESVLAAAFEGDEDGLGIFEPSSSLRQICEYPRPTGEPGVFYGNTTGTAVDEKNFLRSWSNETYLWYDEIDYIDPDDKQYSVAEYFDKMKSFAVTPSGNPRDRFHFTWPTDQWIRYTQSGSLLGYGFEYAVIDGEFVVLHTEPQSPADLNGLSRGSRILSIGGNTHVGREVGDFLYPRDRTAYEYTFVVRDPGATTTRTFRMQADHFTIDPVRYTRVIDTDAGPVGYLLFTDHNEPSEMQLIDAFRQLAEAEVTDLVLDLRYNSGGILYVANQVAYMIAGPSATSGRTFIRLVFNDKHPHFDPVTGQRIDPGFFMSTAYGFSAPADTPLPSLNLSRVFILTTGETCSASEYFINGLRGIDIEVVLIGDTTCGKPYGFYPADNCGTTYFTIQFANVNDKGFGDFADGFSPQNTTGSAGVSVPGCAVADDPEHALGDVDEAQLAAALRYRTDGSCPAPSRHAGRRVAGRDTPRNVGFMTVR